MSKRELTPEEEKIIKQQQDASPVVRFIRSKDRLNFGVGDYLIKVNKRHVSSSEEIKWEPETISGVSSQPKRFLCIYEDEYGIKYIKPLTSLGKELPTILSLADVNDWTRYEIDPDYADHMILDGENKFDFTEQRKQQKAIRDSITKKNKKIAIKTRDTNEIDKILLSMKPGDKLWTGWTVPSCAASTPMVIVSVTREKTTGYQPPRAMTVRAVLKHLDPKYQNTWSRTSEDLANQVIMTQEPFSYETI